MPHATPAPSLHRRVVARSVARRRRAALAAALIAASIGGCAAIGAPPRPAPAPELRPGVLAGYLPRTALPDSLALVPAAPAGGIDPSDEAASARLRSLQGTARWQLAAEDAILEFPRAAGAFACALGVAIDEPSTPHLYQLLRRSLVDAGLSTYRAKDRFRRARPFAVNGLPTCRPADEARLRDDGSYPSGHAAVGWAWALILTELAPERADAILARGRAFGDSRMVCNVHWRSDVSEGRLMGAATVSRLHADPQFRHDQEQARREIERARAAGAAPRRDCAAEAAASSVPVSAP